MISSTQGKVNKVKLVQHFFFFLNPFEVLQRKFNLEIQYENRTFGPTSLGQPMITHTPATTLVIDLPSENLPPYVIYGFWKHLHRVQRWGGVDSSIGAQNLQGEIRKYLRSETADGF